MKRHSRIHTDVRITADETPNSVSKKSFVSNLHIHASFEQQLVDSAVEFYKCWCVIKIHRNAHLVRKNIQASGIWWGIFNINMDQRLRIKSLTLNSMLVTICRIFFLVTKQLGISIDSLQLVESQKFSYIWIHDFMMVFSTLLYLILMSAYFNLGCKKYIIYLIMYLCLGEFQKIEFRWVLILINFYSQECNECGGKFSSKRYLQRHLKSSLHEKGRLRKVRI